MTNAPDDWPETPLCAVCRYEIHDSRTTCDRCQTWLLDSLNEIEHQWQLLPDHLERGTPKGAPVAGSRSPSIPPNPTVLDLTAEGGIVTILEAREEDWRRARGFTPVPWRGSLDQRLSGVVRWLRLNLGWACDTYPDTDDLARDLTQLLRRSRAITEAEDRPARVTVACPCGGRLRIGLGTPARTCPDCGETYTWEQLCDLPLAERAAA